VLAERKKDFKRRGEKKKRSTINARAAAEKQKDRERSYAVDKKNEFQEKRECL